MWEFIKQDTNTTKLVKAILETVTFVGNHLLEEKALLLSSASIVFLESYECKQCYTNISSVDVTLETADSYIKFNSRWLLNQLIAHLNRLCNLNAYIKGLVLFCIKSMVIFLQAYHGP